MAIETGIKPEDMNPSAASVDVPVTTPESFDGGAEILQGPQGQAIIQALAGGSPMNQVEEPETLHDANLADLLEESYRGEISSELRAFYQEDLESR